MKGLNHDNIFLSWLGYCLAVLLTILVINTANADVVIDYNYAGTPTEQRLNQMGVRTQNGQAVINKQQIQAFTEANAPKQSASTTLNGTHTDSYGNKTPVNVQTQTTLPKTDTYAKAGAALMGAQVAGGAMQAQGSAIGNALANGEYGQAAQYGVLGVLEGLKGLGNSLLGGGISGVEAAIDGYKKGKTPTTPAEAAAFAAAGKALNAAEQGKAFTPVVAGQKVLWLQNQSYKNFYYNVKEGEVSYKFPNNDSTVIVYVNGTAVATITGWLNICGFIDVTSSNINTINAQIAAQAASAIPAQSFVLTADETAAAIAPLLQQMLNDTKANHKELINALWRLGALSKDNTQTKVVGTTQQNTFLSAPYTPVGSQQAQQTKIVVAPDGTVTTSVVARPDLAANTSQAPTRQEVGTQSSTQTERPAKEGSTAEAPDICAKNPNSLMCMDMGNADYEDPIIPENKIDLDIKPANIFNDNATCPPPATFNVLGQTYAVEYTPMCNFAAGIRPMMILIGIITALTMCYNAVREL